MGNKEIIKDRLELVISFEIKGVKNGKKLSKVVGMSSKFAAHSLEDLARMWSIGEFVAGMCGTGLDEALNSYRKMYGATEEDVKVLMDKYWHKRQPTFKNIVDEYNDAVGGEVDEKLLMYSLIHKKLKHFEKTPIEVRRGLLYALIKHYYNDSIFELEKDAEQSHEYIRAFIDEQFDTTKK